MDLLAPDRKLYTVNELHNEVMKDFNQLTAGQCGLINVSSRLLSHRLSTDFRSVTDVK